MPMDGRTDICSCNICTSTIHGGRIAQGAREGGAPMSYYSKELNLVNVNGCL